MCTNSKTNPGIFLNINISHMIQVSTSAGTKCESSPNFPAPVLSPFLIYIYMYICSKYWNNITIALCMHGCHCSHESSDWIHCHMVAYIALFTYNFICFSIQIAANENGLLFCQPSVFHLYSRVLLLNRISTDLMRLFTKLTWLGSCSSVSLYAIMLIMAVREKEMECS